MQVADMMPFECSMNNSVPPKNGAHLSTLRCEDCNLNQREISDHWETERLKNSGRFIIVSREDGGSLGKIVPFEIEKVMNMAGEVSEITRKSDGTLLVLTKTYEQAKKLINGVKRLGRYKVKLVLDDKKNRCRAVVRDRDMINWDKKALLEYLAPQGVIGIENIKTKKRTARGSDNTEFIPTDSFIITFDFPERPDILRIGFVDFVTRDFIPDPMRCFKCQRYGHMSRTCSNDVAICGNCAKEDHRPNPCTSGYKCVNCGGPHPSYWRICPVFKEEQQIRKFMVEQKISFPTARRIFKSFVKERTSSYARVVDEPAGCSTCKCECWTRGCAQPQIEEREKSANAPVVASEIVVEENSPITVSSPHPGNSSASRDSEISPLECEFSGVDNSVAPTSNDGNEKSAMMMDDVKLDGKVEIGEAGDNDGGPTLRTRKLQKFTKQRSRSSPGYRSRSRHRKSDTSEESSEGSDDGKHPSSTKKPKGKKKSG